MGQYDPKKPSAFNPVNIAIVLGLAALGYGGAFYLPHWWPVWQLSGIMHGIGNEAYRETDDIKLMEKLLKEAKRTKLGLTEENFTIEREPYPPEELQADRNGKPFTDSGRKLLEKRGKSISVYLDHSVDAKWPLLDKWTTLSFRRTVTTDLSTIDW